MIIHLDYQLKEDNDTNVKKKKIFRNIINLILYNKKIIKKLFIICFIFNENNYFISLKINTIKPFDVYMVYF